jgi:adenine specific DNA methylase Mod
LPASTTEALRAFRVLLAENDAMAYLVNMTPRLVDLHRVLKRTGTLYLHCDPTMSHYLKVLLDTIFGAENFGNEIVWAYKYGGRSKKHFGRKHDVLLRYTKSHKFTFNSSDPHVRIPHEQASLEANYRYVDEEGRRYREGRWSSGKKYRY